MANQIQLGVGLKMDQSSVNAIKQSLLELSKMSINDIMKINKTDFNKATEYLENIRNEATKVEKALGNAFNTKLNTVNFEKFKKEIGDLGDLHTTFQKAGVQGENAFRSLANQLTSVNVQLKQSHTFLDNMATTLGNTIKWNVASTAVHSLSSSIHQAYGYVKALDTSLNNIQIVTQKSSDQMANFAKQANDAAKQLGTTTTGYTNAALTFYQQGLSDEEVKARTDLTLKVSNASGLSAEDSAEYVTAVLNAYQVGSEKAESAMDVLANVGAHTASSLSELSEAMSKVASTANNMGVSEEQLAASLATVIQTTRADASSVGTAFKTIYMRISDIKAGVEEADVSLGTYTAQMAKLGYNVLDNTGQLRDMGEVMEEIGDNWANMSREQQIALARTMAGTRQANNLLALFDNWSTYGEAMEYATNAQGTLQQQQDTYMQSTRAHLKQLSAAWEDAFDSILDADSINVVVDALSGVGTAVANFMDAIGGGGTALAGLGVIAVNVFSKQIAGSINTSINNFILMQENAQQLQDKLTAIQAIQGIPGLDSATTQLLSFKEQLYQISEYIPTEQFEALLSDLDRFTEQSNNVKALSSELEAVKKILEGMSTAGSEALDIKSLNIDQFNEIKTQWEKIQAQLKETDTTAVNLGKTLGNIKINKIGEGQDLTEEISNTETAMEDLKSSFKDIASEGALTEGQIESITQAFKDYDKVLKEVKAAAQSGENPFEIDEGKLANAGQKVVNLMHNAMTTQDQTIGGGIKKLEDEAAGLSDSLVSQLQRAEAQAKQTGQSISVTLGKMGAAQATEGFVKLAGSIGSVMMAIQNLHKIGKIWSDDDLSTGEKITQTIINLGMALPMLMAGLSGAATGWNKMTAGMELFSKRALAATVAEGEQAVATGVLSASFAALSNSIQIAIANMITFMLINPIGQLMGIAVAIGAVVAITDALTISNKEATKALEKYREKAKDNAESNKQYEANRKELEGLSEEYEKLSKKAGEGDSNLDALTQKERDKYNEIKEKIAELNPDMVSYYNSEGELILKNNDALNETIKLLKEKQKLQNQELYSGDSYEKALKGEDVEYENAQEDYSNSSKKYKLLQNDFNGEQAVATEGLQNAVNSMPKVSEAKEKAQTVIDELNKALQDGLENIDIGQLDKYRQELNNLGDGVTQYTVDEFNKYLDSLESQRGKILDAKSEVQKSSQALSEAMVPDVGLILGGVENNPEYNKGFERLERLGVTTAEKYLQAYIKGLKLDKNTSTKDLLQSSADFANQLAAIASRNENFIPSLEKNLKNTQKVTDDPKVAIKDSFEDALGNLNDFITKNKDDFFQLSPEAQQAYAKMFYPDLSKIEFDQDATDGDFIKNVSTQIDGQVKKISSYLSSDKAKSFKFDSKKDGNEALLKILSKEDLENADLIIQRLNKMTKSGLEFKEALEKAKSEAAGVKSATKPEDLQDWMQGRQQVKGQEKELGLESSKEGAPDQVQKGLIKLAKQYEGTSSAVKKYTKAIKSGDKATIKAAEKNLILATGLGEVAKKFSVSTEDLRKYVKIYKGLYPKATEQNLISMAQAQARFNKAIAASDKHLKTWTKNLKEGRSGTKAYQNTIENLQNSYADLLDVDPSVITEDFAKSQKNLKLFEKALEGSDEAYGKLQTKAAQSFVLNFDKTALEEAGIDANKLSSEIQKLGAMDIKPGVTIDSGPALASINSIINQLMQMGLSAQEAAAMLGYDVEVETVKATDTDQKEATGWNVTTQTHPYSVEIANVKTDDDGNTTADTETLTLNYDEVHLEPDTETANEKKENTYNAVKVKSATKKAGGSVKNNVAKKTGNAPGGGKPSGGGGKGKGKNKSPSKSKVNRGSKKSKIKEKADRYHDIDNKIAKSSRELKNYADAQERLTGTGLLKNLDKQIDKLEKQVDLYKQKIKLARQEQKEVQKSLKGYGVRFNEDGSMKTGSYEKEFKDEEAKVNKAIANYNKVRKKKKVTEKEIKAAEKKVTKAQNKFDKFKELVEKYDELMNDFIPGIEDEINEALNQELEAKIAKFQLRVSVQLEFRDAQRQWNEFKAKVINGVDDDDLKGQAKKIQDNLKTYFTNALVPIPDSNLISTLTKQINDTMKAINKGTEQGTNFSIKNKYTGKYLFDKAAAEEYLYQLREELMTALEEVTDLVNQLNDLFLESIDNVATAFSVEQETYDFMADQIEHNLNLVNLLYGEKAYQQMSQYYDDQLENTEQQLDAQKMELNYWHQIMVAEREAIAQGGGDEKALEKYTENWKNALSNTNSLIETWAEQALSRYENTIHQIIQTLNDELTDKLGLDYVGTQLELLDSNATNYLDKINAIYAIQKLESQWQDSIDAANSPTTQKLLNNLMQKQLDILKQKDKLTQYDVDRAEKQYDLTQKMIALQEAQQNKSKMRLTRDASGGYSYKFFADQDEVRKSLQEVIDAQNELYNFDKEAYQTNLNDMYSVWNEFQEKIADAYVTYANDQDALTEHITLLQTEYQEKLNFITAQNTDIRKNLEYDVLTTIQKGSEETYETISTNLAETTDNMVSSTIISTGLIGLLYNGVNGQIITRTGETVNYLDVLYGENTDNFKDMINENVDGIMNDLVPQWVSGVQTMINKFNSSDKDSVKTVLKETFDTLKTENENYQDKLKDIKTEIDNVNEAGSTAKKNLDMATLLTQAENMVTQAQLINTAVGEIVKTTDALKTSWDGVEESAEAALEKIEKYQKQQAQQEITANYIKDNTKTNKEGALVTNKKGQLTFESRKEISDEYLINAIAATLHYAPKESGWGTGKDLFDNLRKKFTQDTAFRIETAEANISSQQILRTIWEDELNKNPYFFSYDKFAHGGLATYTGPAWVDGSPMRPEMVLNPGDTANMLSALTILDDITKRIDGNVLNNIANRLNSINHTSIGGLASGLANGLEQVVHITATFEGQTEAYQIETALNNLINVASQRAYEK